MKGSILPFPKKGDVKITNNYKSITLSAIAVCQLYLKLRKFLWKVRQVFKAINLKFVTFWLFIGSLKEYMKKISRQQYLFVNFSKTFAFIYRGKMEQILLEYGFPIETVRAITMLCKDSKATVYSLDGDIDYIVTGVLEGDTLAPFLYIIYLDYVLWTSTDLMKENGLTPKKARSKEYLTETIIDANYNQMFLANKLAQAESLLHSLE